MSVSSFSVVSQASSIHLSLPAQLVSFLCERFLSFCSILIDSSIFFYRTLAEKDAHLPYGVTLICVILFKPRNQQPNRIVLHGISCTVISAS